MLYHISFLAAVAGLACAAPITNENTKAEFSIIQERVAKDNTLSPAAVLLQPFAKFAKYGAVPPKALLDAVEQQSSALVGKRQTSTGSVVATPGDANDYDYISTVSAGGQSFRLQFDTGGSDLWVFSSAQPSSQTTGHQVYDPSKSTTKKAVSGATWGFSYSDGRAANGTVYADRVVVGGVTATSQGVQAATSVSSTLTGLTELDGSLGLAFSSQNTVRPNKQLTFFDNVRPALKAKLFAADLKSHAAGSWDFGYINTTKYTGSITYLPVNNSTGNSTGLWGFTAGGYNVGNNKTMIGSQGLTIVDSGTSISTSSDAAVKAYWAKVPNNVLIQSYYAYPCSQTLPDFQTSLGGRVFTVPGKLLNYGNNGPITQGGPDYCIGGLQSRTGLPFNIYGLTFMKAFYVVFDQTQASPRLGFATKNV